MIVICLQFNQMTFAAQILSQADYVPVKTISLTCSNITVHTRASNVALYLTQLILMRVMRSICMQRNCNNVDWTAAGTALEQVRTQLCVDLQNEGKRESEIQQLVVLFCLQAFQSCPSVNALLTPMTTPYQVNA